VKLTHHTLKSRGKAAMSLAAGEKPLLYPVTEAGSGSVQEKEKAYLSAIIEKLNTLFDGELTDDDQLVYVTQVIMGKMLESPVLAQQAASNTKEQFDNSPDLLPAVQSAVIDALDAHTSMSTQALNSTKVMAGILDILLNHARLWESLRERAAR
jgi:type I restriction enzyme R subunit